MLLQSTKEKKKKKKHKTTEEACVSYSSKKLRKQTNKQTNKQNKIDAHLQRLHSRASQNRK